MPTTIARVGPIGSFAHGLGLHLHRKNRSVEERILSDLDRSNDLFVAHCRDEIKQGSRYKPEAYDRMPIWVAVKPSALAPAVICYGTPKSGVLDDMARVAEC